MPYNATGTLAVILDEQQVSEKFRKREFVLSVQEGQYPQEIKFQLTQDKCDIIDAYAVGQEVDVTFDLRGRGFNKNGQMTYFTNLEAWKIQPKGGAPAAAQPARAAAAKPSAAPAPIASDDDNDLPF